MYRYNQIIRYFRRFDRVVWLLVGAVFVESMGRFLVDPYLTLLLVKKGVSLGAVGAVLAAAPLAGVLLGAVGGSLADRWGRRPVQILGVTISGLALMGFGFVGNHPVLLTLLNFANGMSRALYRPATQAAIVDVTPPELRSEAFGLRRVVLNIGAAIGPVIGLSLYAWLPNLGFWLAGGMNLVVGLYLAIVVPETRPHGHPVAEKAPAATERNVPWTRRMAASGWADVARDGVLWLWVLGQAILGGVYRLIDTFLPIHLGNQQVPAWVYGTLLPINAILCVVVQLPLNHRLATVRIGRVVMASAIPYALGFLGFGFTRLPLLVMISMVSFTMAEMLQAAAGPRFVPDLAPMHLRGRYMGASGFQELGRAALPLVGGWVMQAWGGHTLFTLAALLALVGGALALLADRLRMRRQHLVAV